MSFDDGNKEKDDLVISDLAKAQHRAATCPEQSQSVSRHARL